MQRIWVFFSLALACGAVKPGVFKGCQDAAFCTRNRGVSGREYALLADSFKVGSTNATGTLVNKQDSRSFSLVLSSVEGSVRLQVDEEGAPNKRYRVADVLVQEPPKTGAGWKAEKSSSEVVLDVTGRGTQIRIQFDPFRLTFMEQGEVVMVFNGQNMLHLEHSREKQDGDPEGWWEESFKTWTDVKARGPQALTFDVGFVGFKHLFGIPEHAMSSVLQPTIVGDEKKEPYRLYNLDVFEYDLNSPLGLYGSIPFMLGHKSNQTVGLFWLNAAEMFIDVSESGGGTETQWISEGGIVDLFFFMGPAPGDVLHQYSLLTGFTALPQLFSLGYHQCRWNYKDENDVAQVDSNFDVNHLPYDVLWLDIEHTDSKKYMTWDSRYFPTPMRMQEDLASRGRKMVVIIDPHIKRDKDYPLHVEAEAKGYYVKTRDKKDLDGWCWPGSSSYLDVLDPSVRDWWAQHFLPSKYEGMSSSLYVWNDMNEPSVFTGPEVTMEKSSIHYQDVEHRDVHNVYGYYYHMATVDGLKKRGTHLYGTSGDRPFVLSRAFFAGSQRLGPIWTGDNAASWEHLRASLPMVVSMGLAGLPFAGADVGGFFGNPDAELLTRWYQFGIFYPFFRAHAHLETKRREPWLFGEETTNRLRFILRARYALLPYIYTRFHAAHITAEPLARPIWYDFPQDSATFSMDTQMMFGPALLIVPVLNPGADAVQVYFPNSTVWYNFWTGEVDPSYLAGDSLVNVSVSMDRIPVYYKGGSIVARKDRPRRSTGSMAHDPYTLIVALDKAGYAEGDLYIDDGHSFAFEDGTFLHVHFKFRGEELESYNHSGNPVATLGSFLIEKIVILGLAGDLGTYRVFEASSKRSLQTEKGPLSLEPKCPHLALVVKKPDVKITDQWKIKFVK